MFIRNRWGFEDTDVGNPEEIVSSKIVFICFNPSPIFMFPPHMFRALRRALTGAIRTCFLIIGTSSLIHPWHFSNHGKTSINHDMKPRKIILASENWRQLATTLEGGKRVWESNVIEITQYHILFTNIKYMAADICRRGRGSAMILRACGK